ncbi:hypothetical protein PV08_09175 [Exophiala spinifera]|uniref:Uncharacterized protein n=1 Tax=Exophiala spinifera TaxID=91928 RepID=A0A0D1ZFZ8_9EURO|nr:uncharacterized protein PV08_09175 [Exophiala spinifera]KIW11902.1 hypothetical protein PV08_09175 [Exophiala spinifera]
MYRRRSQFPVWRLTPPVCAVRTRTPALRTFVSSGPRAIGTPKTGPSNDGYKRNEDGTKPIPEHPKDDDSLATHLESKIGEKAKKGESHATGATESSGGESKSEDKEKGTASMTSGGKSHATGESVVPESVQRKAPEKLEKALPESVHPTKGSEIDPDESQARSVRY